MNLPLFALAVAATVKMIQNILIGAVAFGVAVYWVTCVERAEDVRERLAAGATLVQGYTAFIYVGPFWVRRINRGLAATRA